MRTVWCLMVAAALALSGCASGPPRLDPDSATVLSQRQVAIDALVAAARATADQFGAGEALGVRIDTACTEGTYNWKIHDPYRSTCRVELMTAYGADTYPLPALSGLDDRLKPLGWYSSLGGWGLTAGRGMVDGLESFNRLGYHLEDFDEVAYDGPPGAMLDVHLQASTTAVPTPEPTFVAGPGGAYFASTEGIDWQRAPAEQLSAHPFLVVVRGQFEFAQQPR